ncbi:hypothetical protein IFM89_011441 [Coptis chinensis]|uniref:Endonuclease/exonuclease/phosphatase domain-containing protein n=1 Tax=Coptis chinensis TaxID=261450 RepID=A0A835IZL1_9MAGN|nr:hypothetical protein IFM89_011441 [Coptis chinensis]
MGAAESRQGRGIDQDHDDQEKKKGESSTGSGSGTALAVGAAVGTALLAVAWGVSRYRSNDSDDRDQVPITNYFQDLPDVEIQKRMKAIGELVQLHSPHFICFQLSTFRPVDVISAPLGNSKLGRELSVTETKVGSNKSLVVATSHLKSSCADPNDPNSQYHQFKRERLLQAKEALTILQKYLNVIFCGDMSWNEKKDGEFPLPDGWVDAWTKLKGEEKGYTFDTKSNEMLNGNYPHFRMRSDRILCNLKGFRLDNIEIIGKDRIPDLSYQRNKKMLPVLPSDHYGLLLTICT